MTETGESEQESALRAVVLSLRADKAILAKERDDSMRVEGILMGLLEGAKSLVEVPRLPEALVDAVQEFDYFVSEIGKKLGRFSKDDVSTWKNPYEDDAADDYQPYPRRVCVLVERGTGMRQGLLCEWKESRVLFDSPEEIKERLGMKWDPIRYRIITYETGYKLVDDGLGDAT